MNQSTEKNDVLSRRSDARCNTTRIHFACGGYIDKQQVPKPLAMHFRLTESDLSQKMEDGRQKWTNVCEFSRERLAGEGYVYRPGELWREIIIMRGLWALTPLGEKAAERIKSQFGEAAISQLAELGAPIKKENEDPLSDLFE